MFTQEGPHYSRLLVAACALLLAQNTHAAFPVGNKTISCDEIEERLLTEEVISSENFRTFLVKNKAENALPRHAMLFVTLKSGLKAVFKPQSDKNYHYAEVAAYRISKALGFTLVPPTVYRTINKIEGSLQLFLEAPDLKKGIWKEKNTDAQNIKKSFKKRVFETLAPKIISDSKIFTYVAGRIDALGRNQLAVPQGDTYALFLIDNSTIRHRAYMQYGEGIFALKGENANEPTEMDTFFPYQRTQTIEGAAVESVFKPFMGHKKLEKYKKRKKISYVIWNHGLYIKSNSKKGGRFSDIIYESTLQSLKKLTHQMLFEAWREYHERFPTYANDLIKQELERRDQVIKYFKEHPTSIVNA